MATNVAETEAVPAGEVKPGSKPETGEAIKKPRIFDRLNFLKRIKEGQRIKAEAQRQAEIQEEVRKIREEILPNIQHARDIGKGKAEDDVAEERVLNRLATLGQMNDDEFRRKVKIVATREANATHQQLTEELEAEVEARLRNEAAKEPIPFRPREPVASKERKPAA